MVTRPPILVQHAKIFKQILFGDICCFRPVENFEECVAQVTEAECGQKAGNLVRNYYQQSKLNPLVDTDPDMVCPAIGESMERYTRFHIANHRED